MKKNFISEYGGTSGIDPAANARDTRHVCSVLGWEGPLKKGMATHSSILAWRIPRTEEPDKVQAIGLQRFGQY